jgi:predicted ArsR family transcriptional regulator
LEATVEHKERAGEPGDDLNAKIGVLTRREVEARILKPVIEALAAEFGRERVFEIVREVIVDVARQQGAELAETIGENSLETFAESLRYWTRDNALELDVIEKGSRVLSFNVMRCRYAELYRALGMSDVGATLSCNRDYALIEGFNGQVALTRTQTIMEGAAYCDFRYRLRKGETE